jgi:hypothetical protein
MAEVESQGRVGPEGGGEATVFDTSGFYDTMYNMQKDIIAERKKKQEELKLQQQTWNALLEDPGDVWQSDFEYVNKAVEEYNKFIIDDLRANGIDPNNMSPELTRKLKALEANIRRTTAAAKDNETYYNQSFNILNQDKANKYNKDHAANWLREYADPTRSPQDRAKLRTESNPFKVNYNMIEFIDDTIPKEEVVDKGRLKITSRNKEAHRGLVLDFIMNDPSGQDVFESLKKDGEDEMAFAERVAQEGQKRYPAKEDRQVPSGGGSGSGSGSGSGDTKDKIQITGKLKIPDAQWDQTFSANKLSVGKTPAIYAYSNPVIDKTTGAVIEESKPIMNFVPQDGFYLKPGGAVTAIGFGTGDDGKLVKVEVDYDTNKGNFDAQGYPNMFDAFRGVSGGGASTTTGKTETPAERAARIANGG